MVTYSIFENDSLHLHVLAVFAYFHFNLLAIKFHRSCQGFSLTRKNNFRFPLLDFPFASIADLIPDHLADLIPDQLEIFLVLALVERGITFRQVIPG